MTDYKPKLAQGAIESIKKSARRLVVGGSPGVGKTTFSISASSFAGNFIPNKERIQCKDVAILQSDNEGVLGAVRAGFVPAYVYDFTTVSDWKTYERKLIEALKDLKPLADSGDLRVLVVDLATPGRLIHRHVNPQKINEWPRVSELGEQFFRAFDVFKGVTVIGNTQLKASQSIAETTQAIDSANAKAMGGERSTYTSDLVKGVSQVWAEHSSLWITRELKRKRVSPTETRAEYFTHTQSNAKFEAKSRMRDVLKPTEPGECTLRSLLEKAYGDL